MSQVTRWICTTGGAALGRVFQVGNVIEAATNPNTAMFESYAGDVFSLLDKAFRKDMDSTVYLPYHAWEDMTFPLTAGRQGALNKPDHDYDNVGLLFPQGDATEIAYAGGQLRHRTYLGSGAWIGPHIHWRQTTEDAIVWKIDYRIWSNGGEEPAFTTGVAATANIFTYVDETALGQISIFPPISIVGLSPSALFNFKVYRDDDVPDPSMDVLGRSFDFHYPIDSFGSGREFYK